MPKQISQLRISIWSGSLFFVLVLLFVPQVHAGKKSFKKAAVGSAVKKSVKRKASAANTHSDVESESVEEMVRAIEARNDLRMTYKRAEIEEVPVVRRVPSSAQMGPPARVSLEF